MNVRDKVFVVTGGGNGIGREVVRGLQARGARVAALDVNPTGLEATRDASGAGPALSTHVIDITDRKAVLALPEKIVAEHGQVDGLVNVAGIIHDFKPIAELPFETIERVMAVNFWGTVNTTKAFLPLLETRPDAALVNVASMGSLVPFPGQSAYGASKAAVKLFTEGLIAEHQGAGLKVTVVFPGAIATNITANSGVAMPGRDVDPSKAAARLTSPDDAARQIIDAIESGKPRVTIGRDARMLDVLGRVVPARAIPIIAKQMKKHLG